MNAKVATEKNHVRQLQKKLKDSGNFTTQKETHAQRVITKEVGE